MNSVKKCIEKKGGKIISVQSTDSIDKALGLMRDNRVRAVLVIDEGHLAGIVSQGDCAIKVLLPNLDPKTTLIESIMSKNPFTITVKNTMEECMAIMVHKRIRHLPLLEQGKVVGVVSIGDIVKNIMELQDSQIKFLETYIKGHGA